MQRKEFPLEQRTEQEAILTLPKTLLFEIVRKRME